MDRLLHLREKNSQLRAVSRDAAALLGKSRTLPLLTLALLFCILVFFTGYCIVQFTVYLTGLAAVPPAATVFIEIGLVCLEVLLLLACFMPLWLGKLRLVGLLLVGEEPPLSALFYYFTTPARYARAFRVGALACTLLLVPIVAVLGLFYGAFSLYSEVLSFYLSGFLAVLLFIACLLLALGFTVSILYFSGAFAAFAAIAVGNESISVRQAFFLAARRGKQQLPLVFLFALKSLLGLLLSLVTVGVLYVLWFSHYYNLSYMRLSMVLCQEEI